MALKLNKKAKEEVVEEPLPPISDYARSRFPVNYHGVSAIDSWTPTKRRAWYAAEQNIIQNDPEHARELGLISSEVSEGHGV